MSSGLVLPCSPGSLSNDGAAEAGRRVARPNAAKKNANSVRVRIMGHLRLRFDAPCPRKIWPEVVGSLRRGKT
jgi:hypothetical protein